MRFTDEFVKAIGTPLLVALITVKVPVAKPVVVGVNTTLIVQLLPAAVVVAHVPGVAENGPVTLRLALVSASICKVPLASLRVTVTGALGTFTGTKLKLAEPVSVPS